MLPFLKDDFGFLFGVFFGFCFLVSFGFAL